MLPTTISAVEVTHDPKHGIRLSFDAEESLLVHFAHFLWFNNATIDQLSDIRWPARDGFYWPQPGAGLSVECIRNPSAFLSFWKKAG